MNKSTKVLPNPNSEVNILRAVVANAITGLNNYLIAGAMDYRYKLDWVKGEKEIQNEVTGHKTTLYYRLDLYILYPDGSSIGVFGGNYPLKEGTSNLRLTEAECQAYKDLFKHGLGHLISVQHSSFLQQEAKEANRIEEQRKEIDEAEAKASKNKSNLIL